MIPVWRSRKRRLLGESLVSHYLDRRCTVCSRMGKNRSDDDAHGISLSFLLRYLRFVLLESVSLFVVCYFSQETANLTDLRSDLSFIYRTIKYTGMLAYYLRVNK